jgi:hypothetical protein
MAALDVRLEGMDEAIAELQALDADLLGIVEPAFVRGALRAEEVLKEYPAPPAAGEWARQTSPKQKAAFFARLKAAGARPADHYRRTGTLGRRWTTRRIRTTTMVGAEIGNNTEYGRWVQDDQYQVRFHRGRWVTDVQALEQIGDDVVDDVRSELVNALNARYGA